MPRFTIDIDDKFNDVLNQLAKGTTKADVIRRAVASYQYLKAETASPPLGKRISITDAAGNIQKDIVLP
jgi:hypothetical protein